MMKRINTILLIFCAVSLLSSVSMAQVRGVCGVQDDPYLDARLTQNLKTLNNTLALRGNAAVNIPITFILVADANGNGRAREEQVLEQLTSINALFAQQDILFYLDEIRYRDHNTTYNEPSSPSALFNMRVIKDPNAVNVYVTQSAETDGESPGVTLGYYSGSEDWVVMRRDEFNGFNGTLSHELGHYFALAHPHRGWECEPYSEAMHGNPVSSFFTPCAANLRVEFQDSSNCTIAGDRICDTPPDYNFGFGWGGCTPYTGNVMDPQGDIVDPQENNIMGYFLGCSDYLFTAGQQAVITTDYNSASRTFLHTGHVPTSDTVEDAVAYNYPIDGEDSPTFDQVELDWDDVAGATHYLVVIDRTAFFTIAPRRFIVEESNLIIDELTDGVAYHWRVWPYNESYTAAGWGATQNFRTGVTSGVREIPGVDNFDIFPNPPGADGMLNILIENSEAFNGNFDVFDMTGRNMYSSHSENFIAGGSAVKEINVAGYTPGVYVLRLTSDKGILSRKFVVR